jgi:Flp pilus assembly pilin Flp
LADSAIRRRGHAELDGGFPSVASALSAIENRIRTAKWRPEDGQTMAEYAVVLAVVTLLVIGAITLLSTNIGAEITKIANILTK